MSISDVFSLDFINYDQLTLKKSFNNLEKDNVPSIVDILIGSSSIIHSHKDRFDLKDFL